MPKHSNRVRVLVAVQDRARRQELECAGYVIESGTLKGYLMRQDYPGGVAEVIRR